MRLARFLAISPSTNATVATLSIAEPARARGRFRTQGHWRERLWEISDIVDVLEAWEQVCVGHVA